MHALQCAAEVKGEVGEIKRPAIVWAMEVHAIHQ